MALKTKFYLDGANKRVCGVCAGIADYTGVDVTWVRIAAVLLLITTHAAALTAYFVVAWKAQDRPDGLYDTPADAKFWQGVRANPKRSTAEVRSTFRDLDRRLADLEVLYTSRDTQLAAEIDRLR
ncbi:PspC domain-containing protein [Sphingomonas bacterium]|uniref:PspC domain-containing protein n=1 Tax=Sphingomonas bacterium TaxID=1895847 RepID=UPI001576832C|nr:PspC domain-containing protein [Sphingomonas bacterium]